MQVSVTISRLQFLTLYKAYMNHVEFGADNFKFYSIVCVYICKEGILFI